MTAKEPQQSQRRPPLSSAQASRIMRRAIELDSARDLEVSEQELIEIAREVGVSTSSIAQALRESKAGAPDRIDPLSLYEAAKKITSDARGPGWVGRVIRRGVLMGFGIGVPVGLLMALISPVAELPTGSRTGAVLSFIAMTMVWTVPFSFGARWLSLRSLRRHESREQLSSE